MLLSLVKECYYMYGYIVLVDFSSICEAVFVCRGLTLSVLGVLDNREGFV